MPKRKASSSSACRGCKAKKRLTCPRCCEPTLLVAEQKKGTVPEVLAKEPIDNSAVAILQPEYLPFLYQIVDKLDLNHFIKLSRSCKLLSQFCFKPGEMMRTYINIESMDISIDDSLNFDIYPSLKGHEGPVPLKFGIYPSLNGHEGPVPLDYSGNDKGFLYSVESRKKLTDLPFRFILEKLDIDEVPLSEEWLAKIRSFLAEFPIKSIPRIFGAVNIVDWKALIQFMKDFRSDTVDFFTNEYNYLQQDMPDESAGYLTQNHARFSIDRYVSDSVIRNASTPDLWLPGAKISRETFIFLIKKVANSTQEFVWEFGCEPFVFGHYNLFEVVDIRHDEQVDGPLPETRPLIFCDNDVPCEIFKVLRKDGKRFECYTNGNDDLLAIVFCF